MTCYAGFDLGGTHLKYGLVNENAEIVLERSASTPEKLSDLFSLLDSCWQELASEKKDLIQAAGFGFPGIFDRKARKIIQSPNYPSLDNADLAPRLSRFIPVPFWINNDANMAAFGEFTAGAGRGVKSMILLTIGTGVGSGVILGEDLWQGARGFAGELGHVSVNPEGDPCQCGSQGCLETEVSSQKIIRNYWDLSGSEKSITSKEVYDLAQDGNESAVKAFERAGKYLGIGLSILINLLNPEKILLGGGVMKAGDLLLVPALKEARERSYRASFESCRIEKAALGNRAGYIGSALWARERIKKGEE